MRVIKLALAATASLVVGLALAAGPAFAADENPTPDTNNGRRVAAFTDEAHCDGEVAIDVHYGFSSDAADTADLARPVLRISRGANTVAVQINKLRLRAGAQVIDDFRISKELLNNPADPLNSREVGNPVRLVGTGDWDDSDAADNYPATLDLGDDAKPSGVFTFGPASPISARGDVSIRCRDGSLWSQSIVTGVTSPPTN